MANPKRTLAPGKVNLYLEVLSKRPDGYHDIATLFQTLAWGDDVDLERIPERVLTCEAPGTSLPDDGENIALRAAREYFEAGGLHGGAKIRLTKRIPIGGGLAGGSSDAAAVLRLLEEDARALGGPRLEAIAAKLGSDVPFLLTGGTAIGTGRGETLKALQPAPRIEMVLIIPPFGTDTAKVYARAAERLRKAPAGGLDVAVAALNSGVPSRIRDAHHNDLAEAALRAYPDLLWFTSKVERLLGRAPCMSGSGSTLYDVPDRGEAASVVARLSSLEGRREIVKTPGRV